MTEIPASSHHAWLAIAAVVVWGVLNCLVSRVRRRWRASCQWGLVALGVPVLGWVTYALGPVVGMAVFALGIGMLIWHPHLPQRRQIADSGSHTAAE